MSFVRSSRSNGRRIKMIQRVLSWVLTTLLFFLAFITIIPFIWMFISSFAPNSEIVKVDGNLFPTPTTLANYVGIQESLIFCVYLPIRW